MAAVAGGGGGRSFCFFAFFRPTFFRTILHLSLLYRPARRPRPGSRDFFNSFRPACSSSANTRTATVKPDVTSYPTAKRFSNAMYRPRYIIRVFYDRRRGFVIERLCRSTLFVVFLPRARRRPIAENRSLCTTKINRVRRLVTSPEREICEYRR